MTQRPYQELLARLRDTFPAPVSDRKHDAYFVFSILRALDQVDDLKSAEGISSATNLQNFRFFTNDFKTRTQGIDIVATYAPASLEGTELSFAFNHTGTRVAAYDPDVVNDTRIRQLEEGLPRYRWLVTGKHTLGDIRLLGRLSSYDGWFDSRDDLYYNGDYLVDLEASYSLRETATVTVGGQNVLHNYPEENPNAVFSGNRYSPNSPFGSNGGFYYLRLAYRLN